MMMEMNAGATTTTTSTVIAALFADQTATGRDDVIGEYEIMLSSARRRARIIGSLYAASRFIGYCNLTWATVVLLGGFCSVLDDVDLWSVVILLLAEAARLASATFFSVLRNRSFTNLDQNLPDLAASTDPHRSRCTSARFFSFFFQYLISGQITGVAMSLIREVFFHTFKRIDTAHNLRPALFLFYSLLLVNSFLNLLTIYADHLFFGPYFRKMGGGERSVVRYYEHILQKLLRGSLGLADPIDFFHFAYVELLGREFQHNVGTDFLIKNYGKMLEYLHAHRQGFDHLIVYLEYGDASVQQAAANVPGLWMSLPTTRAMVKSLREGLVTRLLRRLPESGQVGWAAANSLGTIAGYGKGDLLLSFGTKVGDALAAAVDHRTSRSLVLVRAMVLLVHGEVKALENPPTPTSPVLSKIFSVDRREQLEKDLENLMRDAKVHRLRALSAYLYFLLGRNPTLILPDADPFLGITPTTDRYWLSREKDMLAQLYDRFRTTESCGLPAFPNVILELEVLTVPVWAREVS